MLTIKQPTKFPLNVEGSVLTFSLIRPDTAQRWRDFEKGMAKLRSSPQSQLFVRKGQGQLETVDDGKGHGPEGYVLSLETVVAENLAAMPDADRPEYDSRVDEYETWCAEWLPDTVKRYVRLDPDQLGVEGPDGEVVPTTDIDAFLRLVVGKPQLLQELVLGVWMDTALTEELKNELRSQSTSSISSDESSRTPLGVRPGQTAISAEAGTSATSGVAVNPAKPPFSITDGNQQTSAQSSD